VQADKLRVALTGPVLAALALGAVGGALATAPPRIVAGGPVLVSGDQPAVPHVEPVLAAHPEDPGLLFGAAVVLRDGGGGSGGGASGMGAGGGPARRPLAIEETTVAGFRSTDGGRSWERVQFPGCLVDPWVAWGRGQDLLLSCLMRGGAVAVYRSADGGRNWRRPARVPANGGGSADRPIVVVDRSAGPRGGTVYVVFAQQRPPAGRRQGLFGTAVAAAKDGDRKFSAPSFLRHDSLNQQPFDAAVLSDGTLVLLFVDYASYHLPRAPRRAWVARSTDGGRSFAVSPLPFALPATRLPLPLAPVRSGAHRDRLYAAWPAEGGCLLVISSDDRGLSWTRQGSAGAGTPAESGGGGAAGESGASCGAAAVNGGAAAAAGGGGAEAAAPAGSSVPAAACNTPAIAVNGAGVVGIAWYDTRRDSRGECCDVGFSASLDGGRTFLPDVRLTAEPSFPRTGKDPQVAARWPFGGDYSGLAAGADGRFHVFWADRRSGVYQLWTASVEVSGAGAPSPGPTPRKAASRGPRGARRCAGRGCASASFRR
jgi:hypothetical protein